MAFSKGCIVYLVTWVIAKKISFKESVVLNTLLSSNLLLEFLRRHSKFIGLKQTDNGVKKVD